MSVEKVGRDERVKRRATCKNCGAVLEFWPADVLAKDLYCMGEHDRTLRYVVCPECKEWVEVKV